MGVSFDISVYFSTDPLCRRKTLKTPYEVYGNDSPFVRSLAVRAFLLQLKSREKCSSETNKLRYVCRGTFTRLKISLTYRTSNMFYCDVLLMQI